MKKVISFALFGQDKKYQIGAIKNAELAHKIFPEWKTTFFVSDKVPLETLDKLRRLADSVIIKPEPNNLSGMFWRFEEAANLQNSRVIFRDLDSRLNMRDFQAVQEWEHSGKSLHIIRDHPMHNAPILGGLWGLIPESLKDFSSKFERFSPKGYYGEDQEFLWQNVYGPLRHDRLVHDEFFLREVKREKIALKRRDYEYLGESFSEDEVSDQDLRKSIEIIEQDYSKRLSLKIKSLTMKVFGR